MTVIEEMLLEEYERSLRITAAIERDLETLPRGYIRRRVDNGHEHYYLQYRDGAHVRSQYIPAAEVEELRALIERRKGRLAALKEQEQSRKMIERALGRRPGHGETRG